MKAIFICGSTRKNGNTSKIINEVIRALSDNGFEILKYFISELNIGYCCGQKQCEIYGKCSQKDDVEKVIKEIYYHHS